MKKTQYLAASLLILAVTFGVWTYWVGAQPQDNYGLSQTQIARNFYNDSYGAMQGIILAQVATTPQTNYGNSLTQIFRKFYDPDYGGVQLVLSTSTGKQVPFINTASLTDGDILYYDSTGEEWKNTEGNLTYDDANETLGIGAAPSNNKLAVTTSSSGAIPTNQNILDANVGEVLRNTNASATFSGFGIETRQTGAARALIGLEWQSSYVGDLFIRLRDGGTTSLEVLRISPSVITQQVGQAVHRTDAGAADYNPSALTSDYLIVADNSAAARAITVSTEDVQSGSTDNPRIFLVKDEYGNAAAQNLTVSLESGNIDGAASQTISADYGAIQMYCDGTNCFTF